MKFLLDSHLSHRVAKLLRDAGIDATHVRDNGLQHATDLTILVFARQHSFVLVSEDTDFGELLALQRTVAPSFPPRRRDGVTGRVVAAGVLRLSLP